MQLLKRLARRFRAILVFGIALCSLLAMEAGGGVLQAQSVNGTVVGPDGRPVIGAVVELLDAASAPVAHGFTGSTGAFSLRTRAAGRYRVRARQIGWKPVVSAAIELRAGADESVRLAFVAMAVALDTVKVNNKNVCGEANDSTSAIIVALEYARTALLTTDTRRVRGLTFAALRYNQVLDPIRERVVQQYTQAQSDSAAQPWQSTPIEQLRREGYVVNVVGDSVVYRLPGLDMLASNAFVADHCFEFSGKSDKTRLGVNFEPTPLRKKLADIRGTLWLNRTDASLTAVEFRFTNLEGAQNDAKPGGQMAFSRLRDGTWAVTQWSVRMPILERRLPKAIGGARIGSGVPETVVANISVTGGQISAVLQNTDTLFARPGIVVSGVTIDSTTDKPLAGARVELLGTTIAAESEADGKFALHGVLPGEYVIAVRTASLDSVRTASTFPLRVFNESPEKQTLKIANASGVVALICPASKTAAAVDRGVLVGQVQGDGATGARVTIEWPTDPTSANSPTQWMSTHAASDGTFRACGVPMERAVTVRAWSEDAATAPSTTRVPTATRFAAVELPLEKTRVESSVFAGTVSSDSAASGGARKLADAEVAIPTLSRVARTNSDGLFQLNDLPAGTHRITVRKLGFSPLDASITVGPRERVERRIVLGSVSVLEQVEVRATRLDPAMREFEDSRKLGIGKFLTREDLERQKTANMINVFMTTNGIKFKTVGGHNFATAGRRAPIGPSRCFFFENSTDTAKSCTMTSECFMQVYFDTHPIFLGREGETVPDLTRYRAEDLQAAEVYSSAAETPSRYQGLGNGCGTIVLHRRRD